MSISPDCLTSFRRYPVMKQSELFESHQLLPAGLTYVPEFITHDVEAALLRDISSLPLREARYKDYSAKRRIISYGTSYDFTSKELIPAGAIPEFLLPLRERISKWVKIPASLFAHALVAEYQTGTQLGWHRDVTEFEMVVGVSLAGPCRMRLRRYPPRAGRAAGSIALDLEPRSAYVMRGEARWSWQHSIRPTKTLR
jgi:alkylated DNA repair dioxygenase AlkB